MPNNSTTDTRKMLAEDLLNVVEDAVTEAVSLTEQQDVQLRDLERVTLTALKRIGQQLLQGLVEACQPAEPEASVPCRCGGAATYVRQRTGTVLTWVEQIQVTRAYYLCATCRRGTCPLDEQLGFRAGALSADLQEAVALVGVHLPFEVASDLFERLTHVSLSDNAVRQATEQIGQERLDADEATVSAAWHPRRLELPAGPAEAPERLYGSLDETSVRTEAGWRKPKLGSWYTTDSRPADEPPEEWKPQAEAISYYADMLEAEDFGRLLYVTGVARGADRAKELVFVADGAPWIWKLVAEHFPHAVQIVDWYHAAERIWKVAHAAYGQGTDLATTWANQRLTELWHGHVDKVIAACEPHAHPERDEDTASEAITYFRNNGHRMRYPEFRARGYQIGSGTIESGCKRVIGARLKQAGMTWTVEGARQVIKARAMFFSGEWDKFCQQRQPGRRSYRRAA